MALPESTLKAFSLVRNDKVLFEKGTFKFLYFKVDPQIETVENIDGTTEEVTHWTEVTLDIERKFWRCLCRHEGYRGGKKEEHCFHIKACRLWLQNKKKEV